MLKRVHNAFYWTKDMGEALGFYRDVLGLRLRRCFGEDWAEFNVGGTMVALHGSRGAPLPHAGATVVFEVDDLDEAMRVLSARGVTFDGEITAVPETGRFASFRDPSGNVLQIFQGAIGEASS